MCIETYGTDSNRPKSVGRDWNSVGLKQIERYRQALAYRFNYTGSDSKMILIVTIRAMGVCVQAKTETETER